MGVVKLYLNGTGLFGKGNKKKKNKKKERKGDQYCRPHLRDGDIKLLFL